MNRLFDADFWGGWDKYVGGASLEDCRPAERFGWLCAAKGHNHSIAVEAWVEAGGDPLEADSFAEEAIELDYFWIRTGC